MSGCIFEYLLGLKYKVNMWMFILADGPPEKREPVRLTPAWEATNVPDDELNFRNINMEDAHLQLHPPKDRWNMVYFVLLLHGVGILMPWNMFITAKSVSTSTK